MSRLGDSDATPRDKALRTRDTAWQRCRERHPRDLQAMKAYDEGMLPHLDLAQGAPLLLSPPPCTAMAGAEAGH